MNVKVEREQNNHWNAFKRCATLIKSLLILVERIILFYSKLRAFVSSQSDTFLLGKLRFEFRGWYWLRYKSIDTHRVWLTHLVQLGQLRVSVYSDKLSIASLSCSLRPNDLVMVERRWFLIFKTNKKLWMNAHQLISNGYTLL